MPPTVNNKVEDPCQECRDRHLRCDNERPKCQQCERLGKPCERAGSKRKFRFGSSAKYDQKFAKDQVWLAQSKNARLQFVDQGPELENFYSNDEQEHFNIHTLSPAQATEEDNAPISKRRIQDTTLELQPMSGDSLQIHVTLPPILDTATNTHSSTFNKRSMTRDDSTSCARSPKAFTKNPGQEVSQYFVAPNSERNVEALGRPQINSPTDTTAELKKVYAEYDRLEDEEAAWVPPEERLSPAVWKRYFFWPNQKTTTQCACLMRYYTDHLGPWLDIGDPTRHFTLVVPQRARRCPPLLNAIFTVAARHLTCVKQYRTDTGIVKYQNNAMPKLDQGFAIKYQNAAIAYLRELCKHPEHVQDEDLLAATVILRYYDEFEAPLDSRQDETVFRSLQLFIAAQSNRSFLSHISHETKDATTPFSFLQVRHDVEKYLRSYQHASFRIALRQECTRAFMKQTSIGLDFRSWNALQGFDDADDSVWADRHLYHLAQVLQFCFDQDREGQWSAARWHELKEFEQRWEKHKPISFAAIHYKMADPRTGRIFPEIWYMADIHAAAIQYFYLSRILLAVYNPTIPKLGPGAASATKKVSLEVRSFVIELCGIATSMPGSEPALVQASIAIASCGEHFVDQREQGALMSLLEELESQHGYPVKATTNLLKNTWS